jgi:hypothetical protein
LERKEEKITMKYYLAGILFSECDHDLLQKVGSESGKPGRSIKMMMFPGDHGFKADH